LGVSCHSSASNQRQLDWFELAVAALIGARHMLVPEANHRDLAGIVFPIKQAHGQLLQLSNSLHNEYTHTNSLTQ
jgi:hypothetical protein